MAEHKLTIAITAGRVSLRGRTTLDFDINDEPKVIFEAIKDQVGNDQASAIALGVWDFLRRFPGAGRWLNGALQLFYDITERPIPAPECPWPVRRHDVRLDLTAWISHPDPPDESKAIEPTPESPGGEAKPHPADVVSAALRER